MMVSKILRKYLKLTLTGVFVFIAVLLIIPALFAQQNKGKDNTSCASCSSSVGDASFSQERFEFLKNEQKLRLGGNSRIMALNAFKKNDPNLCSHLEKVRMNECKKQAADLSLLRFFIGGDCGNIEDRDVQEICWGIKEKECSWLSGWKKNICEGFLNTDLNSLKRAANDAVFLSKFKLEKKTFIEKDALLAITNYCCFKEGLESLSKFKNLSFLEKLSCEIIVTGKDIEEILNEISSDLAYLLLAKETPDLDLCNKIKKDYIKNDCLNRKLKSINELLK